MTNQVPHPEIICVHDYPTYIDGCGAVRCDGCDRVLGYNL